MKSLICTLIFFIFLSMVSRSQVKEVSADGGDTIATYNLGEITVTAVRTKVPLKEIPSCIGIVDERQLGVMSKTIAPDEALRLVPGVKVDNGTDGSRVHLYIRGVGVLSETGFRGIQVLIDGVPVNDPGGYAPDLYDVDWETVKDVEVVKGLAASMYGGSATGGVVNIITKDGGSKPVNSTLYASGGSYGFWKVMAQADGTQGNINYRISYGHAQGHGYRDHQAFMGDNFSEKLNWTPSGKVQITQILTYTNYFNQNSEGINLGRYDTVGHRSANTDAVPYNEFHETQRLTGALLGRFEVATNQDITAKIFGRMNNYRETSNNGDDYKPYVQFGGTAQYNLHFGKENLMNHISAGVDFMSQTLTEHEFAVPDEDHIDHNRVDSYWSREAFDLDQLLINQIIKQRSTGIYLIEKLDVAKKVFFTLNLRYDNVYNQLINNIPDTIVTSGNRSFQKPTFRFGVAWDACKYANIYANIGTGFLVPTQDELYNNPVTWGGFNEQIKPSTSQGIEGGIRGDIARKFHYDVAVYDVKTKDEFYRYSIPDRGNNTAFFGNMGQSNRFGVEAFVSYSPIKNIILDLSYTFANYKYTEPDSVNGHFIPQSPQHTLVAEVSYNFLKHFTVTGNLLTVSKWYIQVDDSIYNQYTENGIKRNSWVPGYTTFGLDLKYNWKLWNLNGELGLYMKNLFDEQYFGFTEPNNGPDYNSYQPAPGREFFLSLKLRL
jgi:iron complex outermembrane recepter protein